MYPPSFGKFEDRNKNRKKGRGDGRKEKEEEKFCIWRQNEENQANEKLRRGKIREILEKRQHSSTPARERGPKGARTV